MRLLPSRRQEAPKDTADSSRKHIKTSTRKKSNRQQIASFVRISYPILHHQTIENMSFDSSFYVHQQWETVWDRQLATFSNQLQYNSQSPATSYDESSHSFKSIGEDDSSESDDEALQVVSALLPKNKGKPRASRRKPLPRIIKQDIRRHYPQMLMNALNSHDMTMIKAFFGRYAHPAITLEKTLDRQTISYCTTEASTSDTIKVILNGPVVISNYFQAMNDVLLDNCLRVRKVNIVRNINAVEDPVTGKKQLVGDPNSTKIVCDIEGSSTQIYEVPPASYAFSSLGRNFVYLDNTLDIFPEPVSSEVASSFAVFVTEMEDDEPIKRRKVDSTCTVGPRQLQATPLIRSKRLVSSKLTGQIVLDVDQCNRLSKLQFRSVSITLTEL